MREAWEELRIQRKQEQELVDQIAMAAMSLQPAGTPNRRRLLRMDELESLV